MANVHGMVSVKFEDALGVPASTSVNFIVGDGVVLSALITSVTTLVGKLHAVSDDAITGVDITVFTGISDAVTSGAESNEGVNVSMETNAPTRDWTLWIPAVKDSLIVDDKIKIDSGAIFDLAAELVTPSGDATWETPYLNAYTALESAAEAFRKLRGLTSKKTKASNAV